MSVIFTGYVVYPPKHIYVTSVLCFLRPQEQWCNQNSMSPNTEKKAKCPQTLVGCLPTVGDIYKYVPIAKWGSKMLPSVILGSDEIFILFYFILYFMEVFIIKVISMIL